MTDSDRFTTPLRPQHKEVVSNVGNMLELGKTITIVLLLAVIAWFAIPKIMETMPKPVKGTPQVTLNEVSRTEVRPAQVDQLGITQPAQVILNQQPVDLSNLTTEPEVYIRENASTVGNRDTVTALEELRQIKEEIAANRLALNSIVKTINANGGTSVIPEEAIKRIARQQLSYYWNNHDEVANKRGYKNVIKWGDVNY